MTVCLATLCLNEMEWLPKLYEQHRGWPELVRWIFVEAADKVFAETNPELVSSEGLSTDGTTEFLDYLCKQNPLIIHIKHGFSEHSDGDISQNKCQARQRYLDFSNNLRPNIIVVLDADEFYPIDNQLAVNKLVLNNAKFDSFALRHREIWYPPRYRNGNMFELEVIGGFWDILYCRIWRWYPNLKYINNHNTPQNIKGELTRKLRRPQFGDPEYIHMAFASSVETRRAKHLYYEARGEGRTDHRAVYVQSRSAYLDWTPTNSFLPGGARVIPYNGMIPEVFR
jgi:hypothetical protein